METSVEKVKVRREGEGGTDLMINELRREEKTEECGEEILGLEAAAGEDWNRIDNMFFF